MPNRSIWLPTHLLLVWANVLAAALLAALLVRPSLMTFEAADLEVVSLGALL